MKLTLPKFATFVLCAAVLSVPGVLKAQGAPFPSKPIRIVAPFGAGGGGDTSLRMLATHLAPALGQPVVVDNKPGGNGVVGVQEALRGEPDGHTLFYGSTTTLAANASLMKNLPYDPGRDFVAVTQVSTVPFMLVVNPVLEVADVAQLIAHAKAIANTNATSARPLTFASANHTGLVAGFAFSRAAGLDLVNVQYKASPAGLTDLAGGQVAMMFVDVAAGLPLVKAGKLRSIGVTTAARSSLLPDVPAIAETLRGYEVVGWTAIAAPADTPPEVVRRIHAEVEKILARPDVRSEFEKVGFEVKATTPEQTAAFFVSEKGKWAERVKSAGIEPQ